MKCTGRLAMMAFAAMGVSGCAADPLLGTWQTTDQTGGTAILNRTTFNSDGSVAQDYVTTLPTTAPQWSGCTVTAHETGATYTEDHSSSFAAGPVMNLTLFPPAVYMGSQSRTGCSNAADDTPSAPLDNAGQPTSGSILTWTYLIEGNSLTLTRPGAVTITLTRL